MKTLPAPLTDPWFAARFYSLAAAGSWYEGTEGSRVPFSGAQGLRMWCPCGYGALRPDGSEAFPTDLSQNRGRPHAILVPFSNPPSGIPVPADHGPVGRDGKTHPRWKVGGTGLHDLTTTPSIAVGGGKGETECWHGYITNGIVK